MILLLISLSQTFRACFEDNWLSKIKGPATEEQEFSTDEISNDLAFLQTSTIQALEGTLRKLTAEASEPKHSNHFGIQILI